MNNKRRALVYANQLGVVENDSDLESKTVKELRTMGDFPSKMRKADIIAALRREMIDESKLTPRQRRRLRKKAHR